MSVYNRGTYDREHVHEHLSSACLSRICGVWWTLPDRVLVFWCLREGMKRVEREKWRADRCWCESLANFGRNSLALCGKKMRNPSNFILTLSFPLVTPWPFWCSSVHFLPHSCHLFNSRHAFPSFFRMCPPMPPTSRTLNPSILGCSFPIIDTSLRVTQTRKGLP